MVLISALKRFVGSRPVWAIHPDPVAGGGVGD